MKNWVVKLLLLLFIPSFVGILFTVILGFNPGGWLQITTYALPPLLTLAGGAFIVASRWKIPFLILMAAASMAFNIPLQNWLFHSADEVVRFWKLRFARPARQSGSCLPCWPACWRFWWVATIFPPAYPPCAC